MLGRKVVFVRCINCSHNNVAKGIRLLDINAIFVYTGKKFIQVRTKERYIPIRLSTLKTTSLEPKIKLPLVLVFSIVDVNSTILF